MMALKNKNIIRIAVVVGLILLIPLFGNYFAGSWNWSFLDFVFAAIMLFSTGLILDFVVKNIKNPWYKFLTGLFIVLAFLFIWAELSVGVIENVMTLMIWQDIVMTIGQFIFALALIPTIIANQPPTKGTCLVTALVGTAYIPTLLSLGLKVSFLATILVATNWWILFYQSYLKELQKKQE